MRASSGLADQLSGRTTRVVEAAPCLEVVLRVVAPVPVEMMDLELDV